MKNEMQNNDMTSHKNKTVSTASVLLSAAAFFFILIGVASVLFLQPELRTQNFDTRKQASVNNGQVILSSSFQDASLSNPQATINLLVNTQGVQTDGVQVVFNVITSVSDSLTIQVPSSAGLQAVHQEVQRTSDGFLVSLIAVPPTLGQTFSTTSPTTFATVTLTPQAAGSIVLSFDQENSFSTIHGTNPPKDGLATIPQMSFTTAGAVGSASPSPSPSPSPTPSPTPSTTPSPSPSSSPSPSPSPTASVAQCNTSCSANADCPVNFRCYNGACRLATNPSDASCVNPQDQGIHRGCNEYCSDSSECGSGFTCFYNACRSAANPDSPTCAPTTAETTAAMKQSCNVSCTSNKDCAVNLRCYYGSCRLATNPSSLSCSDATAPVVSSLYGEKGEEKPYPSVTPTVTPSPSPSPLVLYPSGNTTSEPTASDTLLGQINNWLAAHGLSLPLIAVTAGIILFVLALLAFFLSQRKKEPQKLNMSSQKAPTSPYEQSLQQKIDALRKAQEKPQPVAANYQEVTARPTSIPPAPATLLHHSSMMERIKEKGIMTRMEKMPNPTAPKTSTDTSAETPST